MTKNSQKKKNYLHVVLLYLYLVRHAKGFLAVERGTGAGGGTFPSQFFSNVSNSGAYQGIAGLLSFVFLC